MKKMKQLVSFVMAMQCIPLFAQDQTFYDNPIDLLTPIHEWLVPCEDVNKVQEEGKLNFRTEKFRLLVPETASFGFVYDPSMFREWSLVYDSVAHALVYRMPGTEKKYDSIEMHWLSATRRDIPQEPIIHGNDTINVVKCEFTDIPINYTEPEISKFSVPISDAAAKCLRQLWDGAVRTAKIPEEPWIRFNDEIDEYWDLDYYSPPMVLDGETFDIFVGKKCATQWEPQVAGKVQMLLRFFSQLGKAVHQGNKERVDSLLIVSAYFTPLFQSNRYNPEGPNYAQDEEITPKTNLSQLDETQRNSYLSSKAVEVVKMFSAGMNPGPKIRTEISGLQTLKSVSSLVPEMRACDGRQFYEVILRYDEELHDKVNWPYQAKVAIWESDGQPMGLIFGNKLGHRFLANPYSEWISHHPTQRMALPR